MTGTAIFPDVDAKRARFLRFNGPARLGNLASTLMRAADLARDEAGSEIVYRMLLEAQLFVGWDDSVRDERADSTLTEMKLGLERLQHRWGAAARWDAGLATEVAEKCRTYSDQALALSGLLDE